MNYLYACYLYICTYIHIAIYICIYSYSFFYRWGTEWIRYVLDNLWHLEDEGKEVGNIYILVYIHICICIYICIYVYIYEYIVHRDFIFISF
jgi:hypothetical protein